MDKIVGTGGLFLVEWTKDQNFLGGERLEEESFVPFNSRGNNVSKRRISL